MPADKNIRGIRHQKFLDPRVIVGGRPADVCYPDGESFTIESEVFREARLNRLIIDIAENGPEGFEFLQFVRYRACANVAGMPDFIARLKVLEDPGVEVAVRVGYDTEFHEGNA